MNKYLEEYQNSLEWLKRIDIPLNGRYTLYWKKLNELFKDSTVLPKELIDDYIPVLHNTFEIMCIYKAFNNSPFNYNFVNKLKIAVKGPEFLEHEKGNRDSNKARNYQFELYMAAMFKNAGHEVVFSEIADFEVNLGYASIFVECKRIRSVQKLKDELKDARKKLLQKCLINSYSAICINLKPLIKLGTTSVNSLEETLTYSDKPEIMKIIKEFEPVDELIGYFYLSSFVKFDQLARDISCPFRIMSHISNLKCHAQQVNIIKSIIEKPFFTGMY